MLVEIDAGLVHVGYKVTEAERCDGGVQQQQQWRVLVSGTNSDVTI